MAGFIFNEDANNIFCAYTADQIGPDAINEYVDAILDTGAARFCTNVNAMRVNYDSAGTRWPRESCFPAIHSCTWRRRQGN